MSEKAVTTYVVQALLESGNWVDCSSVLPDLHHARGFVRATEAANVATLIRIVERRVTTVEEVML